MKRWEIFDPRDGIPVFTVPFRWLASLITRMQNRLQLTLHGPAAFRYAQQAPGALWDYGRPHEQTLCTCCSDG